MTLTEAYTHYAHLWVQQLHRDYRSICHQYRLKLEPPIIRIHPLDRQLATWDPLGRLITISCHLIENSSWQEVLNVLKHEMAHQLCSEIFGGSGGHRSTDFKRACQLLDLPENYRRASLTMVGDQWPQSEEPIAADRAVLSKVGKLLALSRSANEHEAANALAKAKLLIDRHQLADTADLAQEGVIFRMVQLKNRRVTICQKKIAAILSRYFYVRLIQSVIYDQFRLEDVTIFEIFGRPGAVEVAIHCFHFLEERLVTLWRQRAAELPKRSLKSRNSYMYGILQGVEDVLHQQAARTVEPESVPGQSNVTRADEQCRLLQKVEEDAVEQRVNQRYPRLSRRKSRIVLQSEIYQEGITSGRALSLRPVFTPHHGETLSLPMTLKKS